MKTTKTRPPRTGKRGKWLTIAVMLMAGGVAAGCSNQLNDLGGAGQAKPDYILTYLNVANFPNVTLLCIRGAGFATTTRDNNAAIQRVPEWDAFCATKEPASGAPRTAPSAMASP